MLQEHHYYPFGMEWGPYYGNAVVEGPWQWHTTETPEDAHRYRYNGKEWNGDGGLNWLDYGARWYDGASGRWGQVDPLAEAISNYSPFSYTFNNPISYNDPTGMMGQSTVELVQSAWEQTPENGSASFNNEGECNCGCPGKPPCEEGTSPPDFSQAEDYGEFQAMAYSMNPYQRFAAQNGLNGLTSFQKMEYDYYSKKIGTEVTTFVIGGVIFKLAIKGGQIVYAAFRANKVLRGIYCKCK